MRSVQVGPSAPPVTDELVQATRDDEADEAEQAEQAGEKSDGMSIGGHFV